MTERQAILKTADKVPNYFLVKFTVDKALCVIPRKNIVDQNELSVNGRCLVKWSKDTLEATVIALGEKSEMTRLEDMMDKDIENLELLRKKRSRKPFQLQQPVSYH